MGTCPIFHYCSRADSICCCTEKILLREGSICLQQQVRKFSDSYFIILILGRDKRSVSSQREVAQMYKELACFQYLSRIGLFMVQSYILECSCGQMQFINYISGDSIQTNQPPTSNTLMSSVTTRKNHSSLISSNSTFNWSQSNIKQLLHSLPFKIITNKNDEVQPFCHYTHKNLKWKQAPFLPQSFIITLDQLTNVKTIVIENFTHGSQMTISISDKQEPINFTEVYSEKFICKGKTLKGQTKNIDLGALPCQSILIKVNKGCKICSKNLKLIGVSSYKIEERLGAEYFKLLVINPLKIIYPE